MIASDLEPHRDVRRVRRDAGNQYSGGACRHSTDHGHQGDLDSVVGKQEQPGEVVVTGVGPSRQETDLDRCTSRGGAVEDVSDRNVDVTGEVTDDGVPGHVHRCDEVGALGTGGQVIADRTTTEQPGATKVGGTPLVGHVAGERI